METPADDDPADQEWLAAVKRNFYGGDLGAAVSAGQAVLASIDATTCSVPAQLRRARVLLWLVRCARRADALDVALAHAYSGVAAARAGGSRVLECRLQAQYVHVLASLGQNETALDEGYKVLRLAVDSGDPLAQAASWLALGQVHWTMQQWRDGRQAYTQALALARQCGADEIGGLACNGIAAMEDHGATQARAAGRSDEADAHARRSFALLEEFVCSSRAIGDAYNSWMGTYNQACCLFGMGEHRAASELLNRQLGLLDGDSGSRRQLILQVLGDIHLAEGRHDLAIACETEALEIAERLQLPLLAMDACRSLVAALERSGDCRAALTQQDLAARYGGEEFALILTDVDPPTAGAACERLRAAVQAEPWSAVHPELCVTVSIGVVHAAEATAAGQLPGLLSIADSRLYAAKRGGRNRVMGAGAVG